MPDSITAIGREILACRECARLVEHRETVAREKRRAFREFDYWGKGVPGFGGRSARLVIVGLAPGAHGSNRTGRQFTGDASGDFLYPALYRAGFASQPDSIDRNDGMKLIDTFITAAVRCAPPGNKPTRDEFARCEDYLVRELRVLRHARVYLAFGRLAFDALLRALPQAGIPVEGRPTFGHDAADPLAGDRLIVTSYHPSRQNTQTGRLTREMFDAVFTRIRHHLDG